MIKSLKFGALAALGLAACVPALAQTPDELDAETVVTRDIRVLTPEVSRALKIARTPMQPAGLIVGTYWRCKTHSSGFEVCKIKLVVCTDNQQNCVEV
jgi:hypothetical protein